MSINYITHFPPVEKEPINLYADIDPILSNFGVTFSGSAMSLEFNDAEQRFTHSYQELKFPSAQDVITKTDIKNGITLEYDTSYGDRSVFLIPTTEKGSWVVGFDDSGGHFLRLIEDEDAWTWFETVTLKIMSKLYLSFAITLREKIQVVTEQDLISILDNLPQDPEQVRPPLIIVKEGTQLSQHVANTEKKHYTEHRVDGYILLREITHGLGAD